MNFKSLLGFGLLTALAVSCAVKEPAAPQEEQFPVLSAGFESVAPATRTSVTADKTIVWGEADEISVFYRTTANLRFALEGESGNSTANFKYADGFGSGVTIPYLCGFYPYAKELKLSADGVFNLTWPATQTYAKDGFGPGCNPMAAASDNDRLYFKNLGGYLVLPLWGDKVAVESITLKGNAGEFLAGPAMAYVGPEMDPLAAIGDEGVDQIELVCTKPVMIGETEETATSFWFVLPPMVFEEGFTIVVKCNGGEELEFSADSPNEAYEIKRNSIYEMDPLCIKAASIDVTGVSVEPVKLGLEVGGTEQLTATVEPADATNQNVTWTSSDEEVATVDEEGVVTAVAEGEAVITATTEDGGFTAECTVVVAPVSVTGISLDPTELTLALKEEGTLTATVEPADAANKEVVWTSSDENVAQVEDGVVTAMGVGTATITATTVDGGLEAECSVTVYIPGRALPYEEPFYEDLGECIIQDDVLPAELEYVWKVDPDHHYIKGSAFVKTAYEATSCIITPFLDLMDETEVYLSFQYALNHGVPASYDEQFWIEVTDGAETTKIPVANLPERGSWTFHEGLVDLSSFCGKTISLLFVYNSQGIVDASGDPAAPTIEIKNVYVGNVVPGRITISDKKLTLKEGEEEEISATANSGAVVSFTSSDSSVATVDDEGVITAVAPGTATITASAAATGIYTAAEPVTCTVTVVPAGTPQPTGVTGWYRVEDVAWLSEGDQVVIVASDFNYAMSDVQNKNNRGAAQVSKAASGDYSILRFTANDNVAIFELQKGNKNGTFAFYDPEKEGYIYAAASSSNNLKTETKLSDNSSFSVSIDLGIASMKAQGNNTRNVLQYNSDNLLFSCYGSASQKDVAIYKYYEN